MSELLGVAVLAYRNGRYQDAIDLILQLLQTEKTDWLAWFYLAMCYGKMGNMQNAYKIFGVIQADCPDESLRHKAKLAVPALESELVQATNQKQTGSRKRFSLDDDQVRSAV